MTKHNAEAADATDAGAAAGAAYRVLARKYRPQSFAELIGQDAMVRTLSNAFESGRIAQAYMLTGVRGVGKTTTARLIARALNYAVPDGDGDDGPRVAMAAPGVHCQAIMESRHVDVFEMDAASNTGINDVREIIESARYRPVSARYKVYIIDEVHMLSKPAFNGLLKTLEEPPEHVKFIFATTEVRKVPVTVLSRCQRFDLRRVEADVLSAHLGTVTGKEGAKIAPDALALIVRAAEGSVRDGLSLLDQAIALEGAEIAAGAVREMLGLADRARTIDLFDLVMTGRVGDALGEVEAQYRDGADPMLVVRDLADFTHLVTRLKLVETASADAGLSEDERTRGRALADTLSMATLTRAWQMLLKGLSEVQMAPDPWAAAEMVVIRLTHAASLPTPDELIRAATSNRAATVSSGPSAAPASAPDGNATATDEVRPVTVSSQSAITPPSATAAATALKTDDMPQQEPARAPEIGTFPELVALARERRDVQLVNALERMVRLVEFRPGRLEIALEPDAPPALANELSRGLERLTGGRWVVTLSKAEGAPSLARQRAEARKALIGNIAEEPLVKSVMTRFPGAEIIEVRDNFADAGQDGDRADDLPGEPER